MGMRDIDVTTAQNHCGAYGDPGYHCGVYRDAGYRCDQCLKSVLVPCGPGA